MPTNEYRNDDYDGPTPEGDLASGVSVVRKVIFIGVLGLGICWLALLSPFLMGPVGKALLALIFFAFVFLAIILIVGGVAWLALKMLTWPIRLFFRRRYQPSDGRAYR